MLRPKFILDVLFPALALCWAAFLGYSAFLGPNGYQTLSELERELEVKSAEVEILRDRRASMEKRADLLSSRSLDRDLLDERIRAVLRYSREGDMVVSRRQLDAALERKRAGEENQKAQP